MTLRQLSAKEEGAVFTAGRLKWTADGDDLVARGYRVRLLVPRRWETTRGDQFLRVDPRRSMAIASAEQHYREWLRRRRLVFSSLTAVVAIVVGVVATRWVHTASGFLVFAGAIGLFVASAARFVAALSRNILDPYRIREPWERIN
jgi:drug/metabolite transporter superfamily protein YnfA